MSQFSLLMECDQFFEKMAEEKEAIEKSWKNILATMDSALSLGDQEALLSLIPYIETGEGNRILEYIGKAHRYLRILHMIELEQKYSKLLFSTGCYSAGSLMDKYMLTMFAFRRLLFQLSDNSVNDAVYYLQQHPVSYIAVYSMTQNELILPDKTLYEDIASLFSETWTEDDIRQFFGLISSK